MDRVDLLHEEDARGPNIIVSDNSQSATISSTISNASFAPPRIRSALGGAQSGVSGGRSPMWRDTLIGGLAGALLAVAVMGLLYLVMHDLLGV
jgi:hypothetical protein